MVKWDFALPVKHSLASNRATENVLVKIWDGRGLTGYGEGVPRDYVTGETPAGALEALREALGPAVLGRDMDPHDALGWLSRHLGDQTLDGCPAAACALELALLDLAGRETGWSLGRLLGGVKRREMVYSAVIPLAPLAALPALLARVRALGLTEIKVKTGAEDDLQRLELVRRELGDGVRLRVDANGAWGREQALERIRAMAPLGVESVEQPLAGDDLEGLADLAGRVAPLIMADESLCTAAQAAFLARRGVGFNLRLSKCGGPGRTLGLWELARRNSIPCQLGCQVGELGVLSAAGRHFAACLPELVHLEGCLTRFYLDRDVIREDLTFGPGGKAPCLEGPGLGVRVMEDSLSESLVFMLN